MAPIKSGRKVAAILVPVAALLLLVMLWIPCGLALGTGSVAWFSLAKPMGDLSRANEIMVYIDEQFSDAEAKSVGTKINSIENVYRVQFVSREEALENFIADHAGDEAFEGVQPEDLRHRFVVEVVDPQQMEQTIAEIRSIPGVASVKYQTELRDVVQTAYEGSVVVMILSASVGIIGSVLIIGVAIVAELLILRRPKEKRQDV